MLGPRDSHSAQLAGDIPPRFRYVSVGLPETTEFRFYLTNIIPDLLDALPHCPGLCDKRTASRPGCSEDWFIVVVPLLGWKTGSAEFVPPLLRPAMPEHVRHPPGSSPELPASGTGAHGFVSV